MAGYLTNIWRSEPFRLILAGFVITVLVAGAVLGAAGMKRAETALGKALEDGNWLVTTLEKEGPVLGQRKDPGTTETRLTSPFSLSDLQSGIAERGLANALTTLREQDSGSQIALRFERAPFEEFSQWLSAMEIDGRVRLQRFSIVPRDTKGLIDADIVLEPVN